MDKKYGLKDNYPHQRGRVVLILGYVSIAKYCAVEIARVKAKDTHYELEYLPESTRSWDYVELGGINLAL